MDKKITRRAVLGTAVAALAVGPFVTQALRKNRVIDLDEAPPLLTTEDIQVPSAPSVKPRFVDEWRAWHRRFLLPEVAQDVPHEVSLMPDLSVEKKWEFLQINTHIQGVHSNIEEYTADSNEAMYYEVIEGNVETGSGKLVVSVATNELTMVVGKENLSSECLIEIGKDGNVSVTHKIPCFDKIEKRTRAVGRFEFTDHGGDFFAPTTPFLRPTSSSSIPATGDVEVSVLHSLLLSTMAFPYTDSKYVANKQIVIPASTVVMSGNWGIPRIQVVDTIKKLAGRLVVSISGELAFDSDQLRSHYQELIRGYARQLLPKNWDGFDEASRERLENTNRQMEDAMLAHVDDRVEREKNRFEKTTWLVDVESGLVLQRTYCRRPFDVVNGYTTFEHFQMLES